MSVFMKTRMYADDLNKTKFSDYEVLSAINDALFLMAKESLYFRPYFTEEYCFSHTGDEALPELPAGFIDITRVLTAEGKELLRVFSSSAGADEYYVRDNVIETGADGDFTAYVVRVPARVTELTDTIPVPETFLAPIAKTASALLKKEDAAGVQIARYFGGPAAGRPAAGAGKRKK